MGGDDSENNAPHDFDPKRIVGELKKVGKYKAFSKHAKSMGFNSAEHLLHVQRRVILGMARLSMEKANGRPLAEIINAQNDQFRHIHSSSSDSPAAAEMKKFMMNIQALTKKMEVITPDEMQLLQKHKQALAPFLSENDDEQAYGDEAYGEEDF